MEASRGVLSRKKNTNPALFSEDQRQFVDRALAELQVKLAAVDAVARISGASWDVDQDAGTITLQLEHFFHSQTPV